MVAVTLERVITPLHLICQCVGGTFGEEGKRVSTAGVLMKWVSGRARIEWPRARGPHVTNYLHSRASAHPRIRGQPACIQ